MNNLVPLQITRLQGGAAPDQRLIEAMETVKDDAKYYGCSVQEDGEKWHDRKLQCAYTWAERAIVEARQYIRCETVHTTATVATMAKLRASVLHAVDMVDAYMQ